MKNTQLGSLLAVVVVTSMLAPAPRLLAAGQDQGLSQQEQQRKNRETLSLARMPLPEAARKAGGTYRRSMEVNSWMVAPTLEALAEKSEAIVIADVVSTTPLLADDQSYISTVSTFSVNEVVKGEVKAATLLRVVTPGGRMTFSDGSTAEIVTPGLDQLKVGSRYALFLERMESVMPSEHVPVATKGAFVPTLGPQGVFEMTRTGIRAQGRPSDPLKNAHDNQSVPAFLSKIRQLKRR